MDSYLITKTIFHSCQPGPPTQKTIFSLRFFYGDMSGSDLINARELVKHFGKLDLPKLLGLTLKFAVSERLPWLGGELETVTL